MFMSLKRLGLLFVFATFLSACGGGGGSPGAVGGGGIGSGSGGSGSGGSGSTPAGSIALDLVNGAGVSVVPKTLQAGQSHYLVAILQSASGSPLAGRTIVFFSQTGLLAFVPASGLAVTDSNGIARVEVRQVSDSALGTDTVRANLAGDPSNLSASLQIQTTAVQYLLENLAVTDTSIPLTGQTEVSVFVTNFGVPPATAVTVSFAAGCGSFSSAQVATNAAGKATTTFRATGCAAGLVTITASAAQAFPIQAVVTVEEN